MLYVTFSYSNDDPRTPGLIGKPFKFRSRRMIQEMVENMQSDGRKFTFTIEEDWLCGID